MTDTDENEALYQRCLELAHSLLTDDDGAEDLAEELVSCIESWMADHPAEGE